MPLSTVTTALTSAAAAWATPPATTFSASIRSGGSAGVASASVRPPERTSSMNLGSDNRLPARVSMNFFSNSSGVTLVLIS